MKQSSENSRHIWSPDPFVSGEPPNEQNVWNLSSWLLSQQHTLSSYRIRKSGQCPLEEIGGKQILFLSSLKQFNTIRQKVGPIANV